MYAIGCIRSDCDSSEVDPFSWQRKMLSSQTHLASAMQACIPQPTKTYKLLSNRSDVRRSQSEQPRGARRVLKGYTLCMPHLGTLSAPNFSWKAEGNIYGKHVQRSLISSGFVLEGLPLPVQLLQSSGAVSDLAMKNEWDG